MTDADLQAIDRLKAAWTDKLVRVMPPAFAMGQAAGTAAAMSVAAGLPPRAVDTAALQAALLKSGAYLGADAAIPVTTR